MTPPLNNRRVTVIPQLAARSPQRTIQATPNVVAIGLLPPAQPEKRTHVRAEPRGPGARLVIVGHLVASLLGLAIGYYVICCLRPDEFNWWSLPVPRVRPDAHTSAPWGTSASHNPQAAASGVVSENRKVWHPTIREGLSKPRHENR